MRLNFCTHAREGCARRCAKRLVDCTSGWQARLQKDAFRCPSPLWFLEFIGVTAHELSAQLIPRRVFTHQLMSHVTCRWGSISRSHSGSTVLSAAGDGCLRASAVVCGCCALSCWLWPLCSRPPAVVAVAAVLSASSRYALGL